jgi:hypothetical protein
MAKKTSRSTKRRTSVGTTKPRAHLSDVSDLNMDHPGAPGMTTHTPGVESHGRDIGGNIGKRGAAPDTGRLNPPTEQVGPAGSDETLAPEIHDPNFVLKRKNHEGRKPRRGR